MRYHLLAVTPVSEWFIVSDLEIAIASRIFASLLRTKWQFQDAVASPAPFGISHQLLLNVVENSGSLCSVWWGEIVDRFWICRATWENELAFKGTAHWRLQRCQPEYFLSKTVSCIIYIVYLEIIASKERRHFPTKMSGDVVRSKRFCVSCVEIC